MSDGDLGPGTVSVLVPLYNHASTVEATLESLLASDARRIELIVSDDGSKDASFALASAWVQAHGPRFLHAEVVRQPRNLGITRNFNFLLARARGRYVTLLASDDRLTPAAVDAQRQYLEDHPEHDFVFANVGNIDADGRETGRLFVDERRAEALRRASCRRMDLVFQWDLTWARLFARRTAILAIGPYREEHSFEDRWCALKIAQTGRFGYLHRVVHLYRSRGSATGTAGIDAQRILLDLQDVERQLVAETTGMLRVLLWIRQRSLRRRGRQVPDRVVWMAVRRGLAAVHRLLLRLGSPRPLVESP